MNTWRKHRNAITLTLFVGFWAIVGLLVWAQGYRVKDIPWGPF